MNNFIRYYNQNRRELIIVIIIIMFGIILLQIINYKIVNSNKNDKNNLSNTSNDTGDVNIYSVATGSNKKLNVKRDNNIILNFIKYCNKGDIVEAYNMISDECKEEIFPSLEYFRDNYYENNFKTNKSYAILNWANSTYKVNLKENILQNGKVSTNSIQDFMTVVEENNNYKLNINNYIGRNTLNKQNNRENIEIKVICKDTFMSYEIYTFEIINNNNFNIRLDNLENTDTIYIMDENNIRYNSYLHELSKEQLNVNKHSSSNIQIRFTNGYSADRNMKQITFSNIILENEIKQAIWISIIL